MWLLAGLPVALVPAKLSTAVPSVFCSCCCRSRRRMDAAQVAVHHAAEALAAMPGPHLDAPALGMSMAGLVHNMAVPTGAQGLVSALGGSQWAAAACAETMVSRPAADLAGTCLAACRQKAKLMLCSARRRVLELGTLKPRLSISLWSSAMPSRPNPGWSSARLAVSSNWPTTLPQPTPQALARAYASLLTIKWLILLGSCGLLPRPDTPIALQPLRTAGLLWSWPLPASWAPWPTGQLRASLRVQHLYNK